MEGLPEASREVLRDFGRVRIGFYEAWNGGSHGELKSYRGKSAGHCLFPSALGLSEPYPHAGNDAPNSQPPEPRERRWRG